MLDSQDITSDKPNIKINPMHPHGGPVVNAIEVVTNFGEARHVKALINLLKEYLLECGFLLEHNESFEKTLQKLVDQGIVHFRSYPKEHYVAMLEGSINNPLVIHFQGPNLNKKTLVIP